MPPHRRAALHSSGLTFVELLLAVTIFSLLAVGLTMHLRGAIAVWRRAHDASEQAQRLRTALAKLSRDLANAVPMDASATPGAVAEFSAQRLAFVTLEPSRSGDAAQRRLAYVSYALGEDAQRRPALVRRAVPYSQARSPQAGSSRDEAGHAVLSGVERLHVRYPEAIKQPPGWQWSELPWDDNTKLPRLVELTLSLGAATDHAPTSAPAEDLVCVMAIPAGVMQSGQGQPPPP